ncbi:hypothetical protein NUW58_g605 [Xylaria curta]|uniref:Uncharacterized protein n=1 Tax=Xylaria curta TaxID=42375 RepID=A0ACC1PNR6_9PEZI|nr:hypothetical protein NUW58_g605 [Xylaria curta]
MYEAVPNSQAPRIAIKFGAPSSSKPSDGARNRHRQSQPSSSLGKRPRPNALHHDSESDGDENAVGKHEAVTTIGADATTSESNHVPTGKRHKEYVISSQKNRDWKAEAKSKRGGRGTFQQPSSTTNDTSETTPADQDKDIQWGLNVTKKSEKEDTSGPDHGPEERSNGELDMGTPPPHSPLDPDKDAMDALLGRRKPAQQLVIKDFAVSSKSRFSEQDAYERSMQEAADVSTIEEYGEIPEGEFGAAMLRGMGWKGEEFGSKPKELKRRPHLMGLGSKEDEEIKKAEMAKRHGHRERRPRLDEYRRDREREKQERNGRHRDSYKSERERERREQKHDYRPRDRYGERDDRSYR